MSAVKLASNAIAATSRWTGSDHDLAMDLATSETVLGNFDDQEFTHFGITSRLFREGDKYLVTDRKRRRPA